jgi:probable rRNA maturation factor
MTDLTLDLQIASASTQIPQQALFEQWANLPLSEQQWAGIKKPMELTIRIVDTPESQALNQEYRQKDKPTNVLSFMAEVPDFVDISLLGDLVICAPVVEREAEEQQKELEAHWAHMVIHGVLHLLGHDHVEQNDANKMETLEVYLLEQLGFPSPYSAC